MQWEWIYSRGIGRGYHLMWAMIGAQMLIEGVRVAIQAVAN
jgi:hypothetical protein